MLLQDQSKSMSTSIPNNRQWVSSGQSDTAGSLWSSFNLNLTEKPNSTLISPRTIITTNDITDLGIPVAFRTFTDQNAGIQYSWCVAGQYLFNMNLGSGYQTAFAKVGTAGAPTAGTNTETSSDLSDLINVGKLYLVVSTRTRMDFMTASTGVWINVQYDSGGTPTVVTLTDGFVHLLEVFGGRVYVTDNNTQVRSVAANDLNSASASNTLTTTGSNFLDLALVGAGSDPVTSISCMRRDSTGIWLGTINQSEDGCFMYKYDGNTTVSRYVVPDASGVMAIIIKNDSPLIIDNNGRLFYFNGGSFIEKPNGRLPVKNSKYLKNSLSAVNDRWIHPNGIDLVNGRIRILINNEYYDNGTTIEENIASGVWEYDDNIGWYHIMSLSLYTSSITDYGQNRISRVGALYGAKDYGNGASANGSMFIGAQIYTNASSTAEVILIDDSNDTLQKYGYLVTPKIFSQNIQDVWQKIYARFKKFLASTDKMWVKYRNTDPSSTEITLTWTSTTTFTTTTDVSALVGYEVEVLQGTGSGFCSHITSVSGSGTYTVTVDETYTGVTNGTAKARIQNWIKAGNSYNKQTDKFNKWPLKQGGDTWIQLKVCALFTGKNEIDDFELTHYAHQLKE